MSEQICECGHSSGEHAQGSDGRKGGHVWTYCRRDDCCCREFKLSQPRPESSTQVGAKTFEEWVIKTGRNLDSYHSDLALQQAYEAGQANTPAPGRWVEGVPNCSGKYWFGCVTEMELIYFDGIVIPYETKHKWTHYWQPLPPRSFPPAVEQNEDEKAFAKWAEGRGISLEGLTVWKAALKHAREKGNK